MYNKFGIEAFIGKEEVSGDDALIIYVEFDNKPIGFPILEIEPTKENVAKLKSIKDHLKIADNLIQKLIQSEKDQEAPKIIM